MMWGDLPKILKFDEVILKGYMLKTRNPPGFGPDEFRFLRP